MILKPKYVFTVLLLFTTFIYFSCDDSSIAPYSTKPGQIFLDIHNLKPLDVNVDGYYEAWIQIDLQDTTPRFISIGKFNINNSGAVVDLSGQPMVFSFGSDTNALAFASHAFVSVQPPGFGSGLSYTIIIDCALIHHTGQTDSLTGKLTVGGNYALDSVGQALLNVTSGGWFLVHAPTSSNPTGDCQKGVWFSDVNGNSTLPTLGRLRDNSMWVYEGWVADTSNPSNPVYYSMGRFRDPKHADYDSAGSCAGPNRQNIYDKPGQDWILPNCPSGKPQINTLLTGKFQIFISLEPAYEMPGSSAYNRPFPFYLFANQYMDPATGCELNLIYNQQNMPGHQYPYANVRITF